MIDAFRGQWAIITGASSGIGTVFAEELARRGLNLYLVARRADRLDELKQRLTADHGIQVTPIATDLRDPSGCKVVEERVRGFGTGVSLLVNNAGYGLLGEATSHEHGAEVGMVDLNCRAVVDLTWRFVPLLRENKRSGVIIVSSVVGSLPAPWFSTYAATKAFDLYYGEAMHEELRPHGIHVLTVLPGLTRTEFQAGAGMRDYHSPYRSAEQVVRTALRAFGRKAIVVDGLHNAFAVHVLRFLPRALVRKLVTRVMRSELKI